MIAVQSGLKGFSRLFSSATPKGSSSSDQILHHWMSVKTECCGNVPPESFLNCFLGSSVQSRRWELEDDL